MKKHIPYILFGIMTVALFFSMQQCNMYKNNEKFNLEALTDTVTHYKNRLGTQTATIKTLQLNNKQLQGIVIDKDSDLKKLAAEFAKVKSVVKYQTITKYDTITIAYHDSIPYTFERSGRVIDKWYSFNYKSDEFAFNINELNIPNETTIITGIKRKWFLGKETITTDVSNSNPYINVTQMKSANVTIPVPVYKKWYAWLGIGLAGGLLIGNH